MTPPLLLPSRRQYSLASAFRYVYSGSVRTRPIASKNRRQNAQTATPTPGIWGSTCGRGIGMLVYRGVGVWAVLGISYVVGIVAGPIAGSAVSSSLLVAAVTSLLTGFCYAELVTWNGQSSGQLYTAAYQLVGEFVAFLLGTINVLFTAATLAAVSKALSATMDYMCGGKVEQFVGLKLGYLPLSGDPPDFIAAGACLSVAVILAIGLEQVGVLRAGMVLTSVVTLVFFLGVGGSHAEQGAANLNHALRTGPAELLAGASVCMVLYCGFYECGRLSKLHPRPQRTLPPALSLATTLVFLALFSLGIVITLMTSNDIPAKGAPLLQAMTRRDVGWARLFLGCCQIIMLCICLVEASVPLSRQLVSLSTDGLLPPSLARPCTRTGAPSTAHLTAGFLAAVLALVSSHVFLLQVMATSALCLHTGVVLICLYRRRHCPYAPLCQVAATPSSLTPHTTTSSRSRHKSYHHSAPPRSKGERTLHFLKDGMRVIPYRVRPNPEPVNSHPPDSTQDPGPQDTTTTRDNATLLDHLQDPHASPPSTPPHLGHPLGSPSHVSNPKEDDADEESESGVSGYVSDTSEDDIDAAVARYKEHVQVATLDSRRTLVPTPQTARRACLAIGVLLLSVVIMAMSGILGWHDNRPHPVLLVTIVLSAFLAVSAVGYINYLPSLPPPQATFTVPVSPWLPASALLLNVTLLVQTLRHSWLLVVIYFITVIGWYLWYSLGHSTLASNTPPVPSRPSETIHLEPLVPPNLTATLLQTSAPLRMESVPHQANFTRLTQVDTVLITR